MMGHLGVAGVVDMEVSMVKAKDLFLHSGQLVIRYIREGWGGVKVAAACW